MSAANEDGACTIVLCGADGKAMSSSWHLNALNPLESKKKVEGCLLYMYADIKPQNSASGHRYMNNEIDAYMNMIQDVCL